MGDVVPIQTVIISGENIELSDTALQLLSADTEPVIYTRARQLVRIVRDIKHPWITRPEGSPTITACPESVLQDRLARLAEWRKVRKDGGSSQALPPKWLLQNLLHRGEWPGVLPLEGIIESPTLRPNGSVLSEPGYDYESGLLLVHMEGQEGFAIPETPTLEDAQRAAATLLGPLRDFPFRAVSDQAAAVSAILSLVARYAIDSPVPLYAIRAPSPGTGKSLLADIISIIGTGRPASRTTLESGRQASSELRKLILSVALEGIPCVLLDNMTGKIGSPGLCAALTSTIWRDRILGASETREAPLRAVWVVTGNNISFAGDLGRRSVVIDLDSGLEHPEDRPEDGFQHPDLKTHVTEERPTLLAAALTILRAYHVANRPRHGQPRKGSFESWDDLVRGACVWSGIGDPDEGKDRVRAEDDSDLSSLRTLHSEIDRLYGFTPWVASDLVIKAEHDEDLRNALVEFTGNDKPNAHRVGLSIRNNRDRIIDGKKIVAAGGGKKLRSWKLDSA